ncbi:hypothetical protein [Clostridium oceanicum]|uniref:Uncharacterized protein n=1 Tax=Clostridium oceanicum TaxID=1543 RepID=A0ABN1JJS8_9CLOT
MKSLSNKITKTQIATIVLLIAYGIWEFYVYKWSKTLPPSDPIIRIDLAMIYPVLCILIIVSLMQVFKRNK